MFALTAQRRHPNLGAAFDLTSLVSTAKQATGGNLSTVAQSLVPPDTLRKALRASPAYATNRDRAAFILEKGLGAYDAYVTAKPGLFYGSLVTAFLSGYALYKRKGPEAKTLYATSLVVSLAVAWFTRPSLTPAPAPASTAPGAPAPGAPAPTGQAKTDSEVLAGLDKMVAERKAKDPNFADAVFQRIVTMPGVKAEMDANPLVRAAVL